MYFCCSDLEKLIMLIDLLDITGYQNFISKCLKYCPHLTFLLLIQFNQILKKYNFDFNCLKKYPNYVSFSIIFILFYLDMIIYKFPIIF